MVEMFPKTRLGHVDGKLTVERETAMNFERVGTYICPACERFIRNRRSFETASLAAGGTPMPD